MEWFQDDAFWQDFAPVIFDDRRWAEAEHVADSLLPLLGIGKGSRILDACCGVGRISLPLARLGLKVTGVDISPALLEAARSSARDLETADPIDVEFVLSDVKDFSRPSAFDAAICLYTSFGYCEKKEGDLEILASIARALKPGGRFCVEFLGKELAAEGFVPKERYENDGHVIHSEYEVLGAWEALRHRWVYFGPAGRKECSWTQRLYSAVELRDALLASGFAEVALYGGFEGEAYGREARTLVGLAVK